jgi:hypothetical protein
MTLENIQISVKNSAGENTVSAAERWSLNRTPKRLAKSVLAWRIGNKK